MVTAGLQVAAWVVITLIALRVLQLLLAKSQSPIASALDQGLVFTIGH